jgi:protein SCO1
MRDFLTMIIVAALGFGIYLYFFADDSSSGPGPTVTGKYVNKNEGDIGGASFTLTNQFGEKVTERSFRNSKSLVFFGFTNCPDICPATLSIMTDVYNQLGSNADEIKPIFITIDPENDTPDVIQEYLLHFHKDIVGLTGPREEIEKLVKSYKAYESKSEDGQVMHSDLIYFMGKDGKYITHFNRENTAEEIVAYIKKHK